MSHILFIYCYILLSQYHTGQFLLMYLTATATKNGIFHFLFMDKFLTLPEFPTSALSNAGCLKQNGHDLSEIYNKSCCMIF